MRLGWLQGQKHGALWVQSCRLHYKAAQCSSAWYFASVRGAAAANAAAAQAQGPTHSAGAPAAASGRKEWTDVTHQRERIATDGRLHTHLDKGRSISSNATTSGSSSSSVSTPDADLAARPPSLPAAAPLAPPPTAAQLQALQGLIQNSRRVLVLTGAGCSTESNIPDYRSPTGAYSTGFKPMTHQQFLSSPASRARYWARSFVGWHEFKDVNPNAAHEGLARLQQRNWLKNIITQNVDRLHHKAGSPASNVLELHGTTHRVVCLDCGAESCRHEMQARMAAANPEAAAVAERVLQSARDVRGAWERALRVGTAADAAKTANTPAAEQVPVRRPDGDVELVDAGQGFHVPPCLACGGTLKPAVVFFGDSVPKDRAGRALELAQSCELLLVVGSSLMVWSAFRLAKAAKEAGATLAIVNVGDTRADAMADVKVEALAGEVLLSLASSTAMLIPRV